MVKPRLTVDEHAQLGRILTGIRHEIQSRAVQLENAYPRSGPEAQPARTLAKICEAIDEARGLLENALYREHPEAATTHVYYPQRQDWAIVTDPVANSEADCPAAGWAPLGAAPLRVICNLEPHDGDQHHDNVHGDWSSEPTLDPHLIGVIHEIE
jgi:hypothetical protein